MIPRFEILIQCELWNGYEVLGLTPLLLRLRAVNGLSALSRGAVKRVCILA